MGHPAMRTKSGRVVRPAVVRFIERQIEPYEKALRLVESAERMVQSEPPPPEDPKSAVVTKGTK